MPDVGPNEWPCQVIRSDFVGNKRMASADRAVVPWHAALLNLLFPPLCGWCRGELAESIEPPDLCPSCLAEIAISVFQPCSCCGRTLPLACREDHAAAEVSVVCSACRDPRWLIDRTVCLGPYGGTLRQAIVRMKHAGQQSLTVALGKALGRQLTELPKNELPEVLTPVPMHWKRRLTRGAGSSHLLASAISRQTGVPLATRLVRCTRLTQKQSTLSATERKANVRGGFALRSGAFVRGRHVGLVDDTLTTGATANEIARLLKQAGVRRLTAIIAARAQDPG